MQLRDAGPLELWLRRVKVAGLSARRFGRWLTDDGFAPPERVAPSGPIAHQIRAPIARSGAHPRLEAGKRQNVQLAATAFHGVVIAPDRPLSFWRTLGPATAARGFAWGMELRSGCAVPAIGGGLCLVSNALFALAVELGWEILERHGHSMALADPHALDATVAYPYVDLRIAPRRGTAVLAVAVRGDVLVVAAHGDAERLRVLLDREQREDAAGRDTRIRRRVWRGRELVEDGVIADDHQRLPGPALRTCLDCGQTACHARIELPPEAAVRTADAPPRPANAAPLPAASGPVPLPAPLPANTAPLRANTALLPTNTASLPANAAPLPALHPADAARGDGGAAAALAAGAGRA